MLISVHMQSPTMCLASIIHAHTMSRFRGMPDSVPIVGVKLPSSRTGCSALGMRLKSHVYLLPLTARRTTVLFLFSKIHHRVAYAAMRSVPRKGTRLISSLFSLLISFLNLLLDQLLQRRLQPGLYALWLVMTVKHPTQILRIPPHGFGQLLR